MLLGAVHIYDVSQYQGFSNPPPPKPPGPRHPGKKHEAYCLGVCLYAMLHGYFPYADMNCRIINLKTPVDVRGGVDDGFQVQIRTHVSGHCLHLIHSLLHANHGTRISPHQALLHPWFTSIITRYYYNFRSTPDQQVPCPSQDRH